MKLKLFVATIAFLGAASVVHAEKNVEAVKEETPQEKMIKELQEACVKSGNTETSCTCSMDNFNKAMTEQDWDLIFMPAKKITQEDLPKFKAIEEKITNAAKTCGADKI